MIDPVTLQIIGTGVATGLDVIAGQQAKAYNELYKDAQVQNYNDLIKEQRLDLARKKQAIEGASTVKSGTSGLQVSGSQLTVMQQGIFDQQLESLRAIRDLKFKRYLSELQATQQQSAITQDQIGSIVTGIGDASNIEKQGKVEKDAQV